MLLQNNPYFFGFFSFDQLLKILLEMLFQLFERENNKVRPTHFTINGDLY